MFKPKKLSKTIKNSNWVVTKIPDNWEIDCSCIKLCFAPYSFDPEDLFYIFCKPEYLEECYKFYENSEIEEVYKIE